MVIILQRVIPCLKQCPAKGQRGDFAESKLSPLNDCGNGKERIVLPDLFHVFNSRTTFEFDPINIFRENQLLVSNVG